MRISEGICFPLLLYLSLLITCKHEEEQANGKVTESGAYLVKLVFPFAFPPQRGRFLKGYVPPPPVLLYFPLMISYNHGEEQATGGISHLLRVETFVPHPGSA
jgi:hypothetical protein